MKKKNEKQKKIKIIESKKKREIKASRADGVEAHSIILHVKIKIQHP
jgi:hypothetical protein